jgi:hypothetical protein
VLSKQLLSRITVFEFGSSKVRAGNDGGSSALPAARLELSKVLERAANTTAPSSPLLCASSSPLLLCSGLATTAARTRSLPQAL